MSTLQTEIYKALSENETLRNVIGRNIFDAPDAGKLAEIALLIGEEQIDVIRDASGCVSIHQISLILLGREAGFAPLKELIKPIIDALDMAPKTLGHAYLNRFEFISADARRRDETNGRQIELKFEAHIDENSNLKG